jgi:uncharacterized protein (TIGR02145 family)
MKIFIAPLWTILTLLLCFNTNAQDIIYTISGEIDNQKTPLDSISVENLSKQSTTSFGNLPERDDYRINLTRDEYWGSTSVNDILNESGLHIIKNLPGILVVGYRGQTAVNAAINLYNTNGQRLVFKENQVLENGSLVEVEIGNAGNYFLTISSPEETRSFKATGKLAAGNMNIAMQSGAPVPLKSGQVYTLAGTDTEKGDNVKVSVFKLGYVNQPVELTVDGNETLVFPLQARTPPEVESLEATNILCSSTTLNGNVLSEGISPISERGFYWSATNENPGASDNKIAVEGNTGNFSAELSGLNHATTYYLRAYAINEIGTSYGETKNFTTNAIFPSVRTTTITNINQTTATCGGNVTSDGGVTVTARGICWNTTGSPTIANSKTTDGSGIGSFISNLSELSANTTYYVCAYATNSQGTSYGEQRSFTTFQALDEGDVFNPATGKTWMDRNLGASRAATSFNDSEAYGDLYQWGRAADGHQKRNSPTTSTLSNSDTPGHGSFIITGSYDWRSLRNNNLWQGVSGTNNPCPSGYRLPTDAEWEAERASWSSNNFAGAFASPLKLPVAGRRFSSDGSLYGMGFSSIYWSSTVDGHFSRLLAFNSNNAYMSSQHRTSGLSVRCLKDVVTSATLPTVTTTTSIINITQTASTGGGNVTSDGGASVTARGVCWNTTGNPTINNNKTTNGSGAGTYTSSITGLSANTTYYVRAYATNSQGASYGQQISFTTSTVTGDVQKDTPTSVVDITNPATGKTWMDRNLGASRAATSSTDAYAYGDLYQWGRAADGHQKRNSSTTSTCSNNPGHDNFITPSSHYDWRSTQNTDLWQGVNGTNNPCPSGYRLPTIAELDAERKSWNSNNAAGAFASPLKLPVAGRRDYGVGSLDFVGSRGYYWSSTVASSNSLYLYFKSYGAVTYFNYRRAGGSSVRCLKDVGGASATLPTVTTTSITNITQTASTGGGNVTSDGGASVTARGVCWNTTGNPTINNNKTTNGSGAGTYTSSITGLSANTTYYVRAYATNSQGASYGQQISFTTSTVTVVGEKDTQTSVFNVTNPATGKTWMDRNLGASRAATSSTDSEAYGDLYQWGRAADGHQKRNSPTTSTLSNSDTPGHGDFILSNSTAYDWRWRSSQNIDLWQGVNSTNNPCPSGYRLPTIAELDVERKSWSSNNAAGAFASSLKLPVAGHRYYDDDYGSLSGVGSSGYYWSSTLDGSDSRRLGFGSSNAVTHGSYRAGGKSVRCLKD